jgi:hypothetical protein
MAPLTVANSGSHGQYVMPRVVVRLDPVQRRSAAAILPDHGMFTIDPLRPCGRNGVRNCDLLEGPQGIHVRLHKYDSCGIPDVCSARSIDQPRD